MYKCSKCGLGVLVTGFPSPIKICNCEQKVEVKPKGFRQKFLSFFGKKFFITKEASIICDMSAVAEGKSKIKG